MSSEPRDIEGGGRRGKDARISLSLGMQTGVTKTRRSCALNRPCGVELSSRASVRDAGFRIKHRAS